MASTYTKQGSPWIWLRYKGKEGKWKGKKLPYKAGNIGDRRQAELVARKQSELEADSAPVKGQRFDDWVLPWLRLKYGGSTSTTLDVYSRMWYALAKFLAERSLTMPGDIDRSFIEQYVAWRTAKKKAGRNQAIAEIKMMGMILIEATNRGYCRGNPLAKPGLKKTAAKRKLIWDDAAMKKGAKHFEHEQVLWMMTAFYFGVYQACRLRQCQVPLECIRLDLDVIQYPPHLVKGRQGYSQPIDPRFKPILERLMKLARKSGLKTICEIPEQPSLIMRRALDRAGLKGYVHHGLRATWITRAAENAIPESQAMAFCHHESREVHRIYKQLSVVEIKHLPALMQLPAL